MSRPAPLFEAYLAGYRFYYGDTVIERMRVGMPLQLRREPPNPDDLNATEVLTCDGVKLGYVPMRLNPRPASLLDSGMRLVAEIVDLDPDAVPWERVKVRVVMRASGTRCFEILILIFPPSLNSFQV